MTAGTALADIRSVQVPCWSYNDALSGTDLTSAFPGSRDWPGVVTDYARAALEVTDTGSNDIQSQGQDFDEDTEEHLLCAVNVPPDYKTTSSSLPRLVLMGWSITDEICEFNPGTRTVIFGVSSRSYAGGDSASQAWSTEATGTMNFACDTNACAGGTLDCNRSDIIKSVEVDAAVNVSDWNPLELLLLRIRRKVLSDTLDSDFHLVTVLLKYDAAY